jgi:predicted MFS family arabinose efflux permease
MDRFGRRVCSQVAQSISLLVSSTVALLLWLDQLTYWHLALAGLVAGACFAIDWPSRRSLIPDLVSKEQTVNAMMLENLAQNTSNIAGPFLSGLFLAVFGGAGGYTLLAFTSLGALIALLQLTRQPIPRDSMPEVRSGPWKQIRDGFSYARHSQPIMGVMWITLIMNYLAFPYLDLLPVFARDILNQGPLQLGLLGAANGIGAMIGLVIMHKIRYRVSNGWIFIVGCAFQTSMIAIFGMSTIFTLSFIVLVLSGIGRVCFGVMQSSIMLLEASDEMRSRAMGSLTLPIGLGPFGRIQVGALAEVFGAPFAITFHGVLGAIAVAAVALALPSFRNSGKPEPVEAVASYQR